MPVPHSFRLDEADVLSFGEAGGHGSGPSTSPSIEPTADPRPAPTDNTEAYALAIQQAGMAGPAVVLLGTFKPLAWLGGQILWALQPFASRGGNHSSKSGTRLQGLAKFLEQEGSIDDLVNRLHNRQPGQHR